MTADELAMSVGHEAAEELQSAVSRIKHCLRQLNDEQVWQRPHPSLNSIGNLILHLTGNVTQWLVAGLKRTEDKRNRPAEFAERGPIAREELLPRLDAAVGEAVAVLKKQTAEQLKTPRKIQGFDVTGLAALFNSVPHFRGHTQEIIHMTRLQLGDQYQFAWTPQTPEQGGPT